MALEPGDRSTSHVPVLLPKSLATHPARPGQTFEIHRVGAHADLGVVYRGVWISERGREAGVVAVRDMTPVEGHTVWGRYDVDNDEILAS